jgi:hypothetical protein
MREKMIFSPAYIQLSFLTRGYVVVLLFDVVSLSFYGCTLAQVQIKSASRSTFPRQEVNADIRNGIQVIMSGLKQSKADKGLLDNSTVIQKLTYSSNGKLFNATLAGRRNESKPSAYGASTVACRMLVDADNNPIT